MSGRSFSFKGLFIVTGVVVKDIFGRPPYTLYNIGSSKSNSKQGFHKQEQYIKVDLIIEICSFFLVSKQVITNCL